MKKPYLLQRYRLPAETTWRATRRYNDMCSSLAGCATSEAEDSEEFLSILGKKMGKLVKGGEAAARPHG